jgi:2-polyprenyl-6-hydroxyphenyl methylase/3-demethylubiquinone-9 3-methyltransferase
MGYYSEKLGGARLRECYEVASPRVRQYLNAEIRFVVDRLGPRSNVLELGCGYGRVVLELAKVAERVVGIDTSTESLILARKLAGSEPKCEFIEMDAVELGFPDDEFDATVCVQNGICAFGVDQERLVREALRVTRSGGRVLLSSYTERFFPHRLEWFQRQAERGLVGQIDPGSTGDGVIVCEDGFRVGAMGSTDFEDLCARIGLDPVITDVDGSSVFCELVVLAS